MTMHKRYRDKIQQNFPLLVDSVNPDILIEFLLLKGALNKEGVENISNVRSDNKHKIRLLLFEIMKKDNDVYRQFVEGLELFGVKRLFLSGSSGARTHRTTVIAEGNSQSNEEESISITNLNISNNNNVSQDLITTNNVQSQNSRKSLVIDVKMAKKFPNTNCDNTYDTKSMKRGQVLIINNKFFNPPHKVRTGSEIDLKCLRELFKQMHMEVEFHEDLDKSQMEQVILQFAKFDAYKISDICIIVIMSHGTEREKEQVVLDRYGQGLKTSWIEDQFNNVNCTLFSGKPKVLLYQLCRGKQPDFATTKIKDKEDATNDPNVVFTETDRNQNNAGLVETDSGLIFQTERRLEDMLVGYATQRGRQAHRDPILGSWYIQLICEVLMEKAHDTQLIEMLNEVDRKMKMLSSQDYTMQTSSYTSNGFNKSLYFNPGIYLDASGNVQKFI